MSPCPLSLSIEPRIGAFLQMQSKIMKVSQLHNTIATLFRPIDWTVAIRAIWSCRDELNGLFCNCLPTISSCLLHKALISQEVYEEATNRTIDKISRSYALLDCLEAKTKAVPQEFIKFVQVLKANPYLQSMGNQLVLHYSKFNFS